MSKREGEIASRLVPTTTHPFVRFYDADLVADMKDEFRERDGRPRAEVLKEIAARQEQPKVLGPRILVEDAEDDEPISRTQGRR